MKLEEKLMMQMTARADDDKAQATCPSVPKGVSAFYSVQYGTQYPENTISIELAQLLAHSGKPLPPNTIQAQQRTAF